jgi:hypothetical protein
MTKKNVLRAAQHKRRYWRRRAKGLCVRCQKESGPYALCDDHIKADSGRKRLPRVTRILPILEVIVAPRCQCGLPPMSNLDVCWCCSQRKAA